MQAEFSMNTSKFLTHTSTIRIACLFQAIIVVFVIPVRSSGAITTNFGQKGETLFKQAYGAIILVANKLRLCNSYQFAFKLPLGQEGINETSY